MPHTKRDKFTGFQFIEQIVLLFPFSYSGLLKVLFNLFYEEDFIYEAAFRKWAESSEVPLGKGKANHSRFY